MKDIPTKRNIDLIQKLSEFKYSEHLTIIRFMMNQLSKRKTGKESIQVFDRFLSYDSTPMGIVYALRRIGAFYLGELALKEYYCYLKSPFLLDKYLKEKYY